MTKTMLSAAEETWYSQLQNAVELQNADSARRIAGYLVTRAKKHISGCLCAPCYYRNAGRDYVKAISRDAGD